MDTPPTLRDIAERAQVTVATVSMALRNHPRISAATRERVQALAAQLGYRPNPYVVALMHQRRKRSGTVLPTLAVAHNFETRDGWRHHESQNHREALAGALDHAADRGYRTEEFWLREPGVTHQRFSDILYARGIHGLILAPSAKTGSSYHVDWSRFAVVNIGSVPPGLALHRVVHDNYSAAMQAVGACVRLGYRAPGLVVRSDDNRRLAHVWEAGFLMGQDEHQPVRRVPPLVLPSFDDTDLFRAWFRAHRPDVLVTNAHWAMDALLAPLSLSAPGDLPLVSLSAPEVGNRVSGVWQNSRLVGAKAVDLLISLLEQNLLGLPDYPVTLLVAGRWNQGVTLPPAPAHPARAHKRSNPASRSGAGRGSA